MAKRGQAQIIVFILLLMISLVLVFTAVGWGQGISQKNIDVGQVTAAENWMKALDTRIESVVRSGGSSRLDYPLAAQIGLSDVDLNDYVEIKMPVTIDLPTNWINLTSSADFGLIRERKEGPDLKLQLSYPLRPGFAIDLFTDGPQVSIPVTVFVDRNVTYMKNIGGTNYTVVSVRLRFV